MMQPAQNELPYTKPKQVVLLAAVIKPAAGPCRPIF